MFTFINDYYKQQENISQKSDHSSDEKSNRDHASGSKSKDDKSNLEEILEEKQSPGPDENFLSSISRDGLRGPYGMTTNYDEDTTNNKYRQKAKPVIESKPSVEPVMSPNEQSMKPRLRPMSNQSTPIRDKPNYNVINRNKNQTTAMKRRRKRDPTIWRRGIDSMNPYWVIRDESENLEW